jgi:hypothetical protein
LSRITSVPEAAGRCFAARAFSARRTAAVPLENARFTSPLAAMDSWDARFDDFSRSIGLIYTDSLIMPHISPFLTILLPIFSGREVSLMISAIIFRCRQIDSHAAADDRLAAGHAGP